MTDNKTGKKDGERIRVLVTLGSLGVGGNEMFAMNLFRHIDRDAFQMDFAVFDTERLTYFDEIKELGGQVFFCDSKKRGKIPQLLEETRKLRRVMKREKTDIVHCNSCSFLGILPGVLAARRCGVRAVAHAHNVGAEKDSALDRLIRRMVKAFLCRRIDYGFACSKTAAASKYTERFLESGRYVLIHNAIETERFLFDGEIRKRKRRELGIGEDAVVVGHVGRVEESKNHAFLLDVFARVLKKRSSARLLLAGSGSLLEEMKKKAETLGIRDAVLFLGQRSDVQELYQAMDVFALPSLFEGFPFVLVEAQVNGLACVVSDSVSDEVNVSGGVTFLIPDDAQVWADTLLAKAEKRLDPESVACMRTAYDLKTETRRIEELYRGMQKEKA